MRTNTGSPRRLAVLGFSAGAAGFLAASVAPAAATVQKMTAAPLAVTVTCTGRQCEAGARGGSGVYEGFEWGLAEEMWDVGYASGADATPYCVDGMMLGPSATVTDSNGATASGSAWVFC